MPFHMRGCSYATYLKGMEAKVRTTRYLIVLIKVLLPPPLLYLVSNIITFISAWCCCPHTGMLPLR